EHSPAVEQWRGLVETYWPAELVEEALSVIHCESRGNPLAVNSTSSASGLFQFLPSTWATASPRAGWDGADV
ncbi:MAG: transglycosylase SLT domain-containing protein, partial [Actinobacteria bacterium]|nr:lytic transglycosylase domain-containing protein [Actinomycetota bacterium]NIS33170.1 lytic transglycosylase domain-containing protein [Actinomycetota bacterium]NIU68087.1 lytic transglycosylase domain-containing protein [Actinomycetota bacterium]NIV56860.1 transglycosylase SLT domain-containing protein [Actinomycetota bacterium]NIV88408.1 transglycosylase SLT domain-containing protein [Actinomycetota bacterium]